MERRAQSVIDACFEMDGNNPIISIHDVGAGGSSNALPELVAESDRGAIFILEAIDVAEKGLSPLEIWCNESQERYVIAIARKDMECFDRIAKREKSAADPINMLLSILFGQTPNLIKEVAAPDTRGHSWEYHNIDLSEAASWLLCLLLAAKVFNYHRKSHSWRTHSA